MENTFKNFIKNLANTKLPPNVYNQYDYTCLDNKIRRDNFLIYLRQIYRLNPRIILIAEAPGYRGSRITGVPFTSEYLLINNIEGLDLFGEKNGYKLPRKKDRLIKEATATIIWETMIKYNLNFLSWNAFPFHPYQANNPKSNRTPLQGELEIGQEFILDLLKAFQIEHIIAVGRKAEESLNKLGIPSYYVRHPAQGGKNQFVKGIRNLKDLIYS